MANETTVSTLAGYFHTQLIDKLAAPYAIDANCSINHVRVAAVPQGTVAVSFATTTKDTALSTTIVEATGAVQVALDTTKATATSAEVGLLRQSTERAQHNSLYGAEGLLAQFISDGVAMCYEKMETDTNAEWTNASTSVGTSTATFKLADLGSALAQHTINKSLGSLYGYLHATAGKNLRNEVLGSGATWLGTGAGNGLFQRTNADGYMGEILGVPLYTNNLGLTSSSDKLSCIMVDGGAPGQAEYCSTALAIAWLPKASPVFANPVFSGGIQVAITTAYGLVEVQDHGYVKAATIA